MAHSFRGSTMSSEWINAVSRLMHVLALLTPDSIHRLADSIEAETGVKSSQQEPHRLRLVD